MGERKEGPQLLMKMQSPWNSNILLPGMQSHTATLKTSCWYIWWSATYYLFNPELLLLEIYWSAMKIYIHTKISKQMLSVLLFVIDPSFGKPRCLSAGKWINKLQTLDGVLVSSEKCWSTQWHTDSPMKDAEWQKPVLDSPAHMWHEWCSRKGQTPRTENRSAVTSGWETGADGASLYLDRCGSYRTECICQNLKNYTKMSEF